MSLQRRTRLSQKRTSVCNGREVDQAGKGARPLLEPMKRKTLREVLESLNSLPKPERFPELDDPRPAAVRIR